MTPLAVAAVVTLAVLAPRPAAATECLVRGTSVTLQEGTVRPKGKPAFHLGIVDVPATATLPRCGAPTVLDVTGAVELTIERKDVWLHVSRDVTTTDGLVTLKHGASVIDACVAGDRVLVTAATYSNDILPGEDKRPDHYIRKVEVPCDALTLDPVENDDDDFLMPMSADATEHGFELRDPNRTSVTLRAQPNAKARGVTYAEPNCSGGCIQLTEIRGQKGWVLVEVGGEGVLARGWVRRSELKAVANLGLGNAYGCFGDHASGDRFAFGGSHLVEREGSVRAGTTIYASAGAGAWGRFAQATHIKVLVEAGSAWAELRTVPGLDSSVSGYVRLDALTLDPVTNP